MSEHQTSMTPEASEALIRYLDAQDELREKRFNEQWESLSAREQSLVREAAVMGYVRGSMFGEVQGAKPRDERQQIPRDTEIVKDVFGGCQSFDDIYPTISHLGYDLTEEVNEWLLKQDGIDEARIASLTPDERHNATLHYLKADDDEE